LEEAYAELERRGREWLREESAQGILLESSFVLYSADMRYEGQAFQIEVSVPSDERGRRAAIAQRFHTAYHAILGVSDPQRPSRSSISGRAWSA
jgi:N-methylhydantoinase A